MDRDEYLKKLATYLAEIEYSTLLADPTKAEAAYRTAYSTASLRTGSAVRTVVKGLRARGLHSEAAEMSEQGELLGLVSREDATGDSFSFIWVVIIILAVIGFFSFF